MSLFDGILGVAQEAVRADVTIASNVTPAVTVPLYGDGAGAARAPGPADFLLRMLKPSVRVRTNLGDFAFAPWGDPDPDAFKGAAILGSAAAVLFFGFATYGLLRAMGVGSER
jgi:hypothetical protein